MMTDWSLAPVQERAMATVTEWGLEVRRAQEDARSAAEMLRRAMGTRGTREPERRPAAGRMEWQLAGTGRDSA
jgi:hypothetical protein